MAGTDYPALENKHFHSAALHADRNALIRSMGFLRGGIIAEVGVALGDFSEFLLKTLEPKLFVGFDIFRLHEYPSNWGVPSEILFAGKTQHEFYRERFHHRGSQVITEVGPSDVRLLNYPDQFFDMIYIDADHSYEAVKRDALIASQKLKSDGILIFNDYVMFDPFFANAPYGVVQAVNEMVVAEGWQVIGFALQRQMFCDIAIQREGRNAPSWRPIVDVVRGGQIGDVLMCTPALRELKRRRPNCHIRFYTENPSLVRGLPYLDEVLPVDAAPRNAIVLGYEFAAPPDPQMHLSQVMGDGIGVRVTEVRPDCIIDRNLVDRFRNAWWDLPHPHVTVNRHASNWTPNKNWPLSHWQQLIRQLSQRAGVIEIGNSCGSSEERFGSFYIDLRGRTTLEEFAAAIAACDLHVGPPSGPVHIAAAAGIRSVVLTGGYEGPANAAYPGNIGFHTPVECSPCWLRTPCPHGLKCLHEITPQQVEGAVFDLWGKISGLDPRLQP
jgi:hypothetical protein